MKAALLSLLVLMALLFTPSAAAQLRQSSNAEFTSRVQEGLDAYAKKDLAAAETVFLKLLDETKASGSPPNRMSLLLNNLGIIYRDQSRFAEARSVYERALFIKEQEYGKDHATVATAVLNLGELCMAEKRCDEAAAYFTRALAFHEKQHGPNDIRVGVILVDLGAAQSCQGKHADAVTSLERALTIRESWPGASDDEKHTEKLTTLLDALGREYAAVANYPKARETLQRALSNKEASLGMNDPSLAATLQDLADVYAAESNVAKAKPLYRRALAIREKVLDPDHADIATTLEALAAALEKSGGEAEATKLKDRATAIRATQPAPKK